MQFAQRGVLPEHLTSVNNQPFGLTACSEVKTYSASCS